jgi:hypothetical protein
MLTKYKNEDVQLSKEAAEILIGYLYIQIEELQVKYCSEDIARDIEETSSKEESEFIPWSNDMPF